MFKAVFVRAHAFVLLSFVSLIGFTNIAQASTPGFRLIEQSQIPADHAIRAVLMLDQVPQQSDLEALQALGITVQGLKHLPMVLSKGTVSQLGAAITQGIAKDAYIDRQLQWHSAESTAAMSADLTRQMGFDGSGVVVAIVDSGIDASHPDLENRVIRNVRVYSPEYLDIAGISEPTGITWPSEPALVLSFDDLPYNNTDTIGHGTHVAGITAGEGVGDGELVGVAPGAELVGYSTGEILFIFTALASFDDILATHEEYGIQVINNSWGSRFHVFDPNSPINVATKALTDAGMTVMFSAGNDGIEMTTNVHSMAPWVTMSGSATVSKEKSSFSSSGLMFDNSYPLELDNGHVRYEGDGLGMSHPDVSAPGSDIISTCTPTGAIVCGAVLPGGSSSASGTSMSSPHMAGLAAVLLQANPALTPDMIRQVMQVSSVPMRDDAKFWQSGFGFVDAKAAVDLVTRADFNADMLDDMEQAMIDEVMARRSHKVVAQDQWEFISIGATAFGLETYDFPIAVSAETTAIRASVAFPGDLGIVGLNLLFEWGLELVSPDGEVVATSELVDNLGYLHFDLLEAGMQPADAEWTVRAIGYAHISQPGLLWGHSVTVAAVQLQAQQSSEVPEGPSFTADGELTLAMTGGAGQFFTPEGCSYDLSGVSAELSADGADADCNAGTVGYLVNYAVGTPAEFVSAPLDSELTVGGNGVITTWLATELQPVYSLAFGSGLTYTIDAINESGEVVASIGSGELTPLIGPVPTESTLSFELPATTLPAGSQVRLRMLFSGVYTSAMRLLWGGDYASAGLMLQTGSFKSSSIDQSTQQRDLPALDSRGGASDLLLILLGLLSASTAFRARRRR